MAQRILDALYYIDPESVTYEEWIHIGMALKDASNFESVGLEDWTEWSRRDPGRFHEGECERKWNSFRSEGITKATLFYTAIEQGWKYNSTDKNLDWDVWIDVDEEPELTNNGKMLYTFLKSVYNRNDRVNFVLDAEYNKEKDKWHPKSMGNSAFTAGELMDRLERYDFNLSDTIGDTNHEAGCWIRFNPVDGKGVNDKNITEYKYCLIECDDIEKEKQLQTIIRLKLPCAAIIDSGGRSIHAIVKIDASDLKQYRERVEWLYEWLEENGLKVDPNNKNPSRLTRMPGVIRNGQFQELVTVQVGAKTFEDFRLMAEQGMPELPDIEELPIVTEEDPEMSNELIYGVLRQGHKMILAGPSKAGKSFSLIELMIDIAEGKKWLGFQCRQGRVLYVNLEIDRASFYHRIKDVYAAHGIDIRSDPAHLENIDIWNLRGKVVPLEQLAAQLIARAKTKNYSAIIIDPIYKVQNGDENSAGDISKFTNQLDKIVSELGTSLIYCHHHSKGGQGLKKSMDRASGSGVFTRDADAIIDLIELDTMNINIEEYKDCSAWRVEGTLREFPPFEPINMFFKFPIHEVDTEGYLERAQLADGTSSVKRKKTKQKKSVGEEFEEAFSVLCRKGENHVDENALAKFFDKKSFEGIRNKLRAANKLNKEYNYIQRDGRIYKIKINK